MLGQPVTMLIPQVVGFELTGKLPRARRPPISCSPSPRCSARRASSASSSSSSATASPVCRSRIARRSPTCRPSSAARAPCSRSTPRRCATRAPGRAQEQIALVEAYAKAQGLFRTNGKRARYTDTLEPRSRNGRAEPRGPEAPAGPRAAAQSASATYRAQRSKDAGKGTKKRPSHRQGQSAVTSSSTARWSSPRSRAARTRRTRP